MDEDINNNPFFNILKNKYSSLYSKAAEELWIILVPRKGSIDKSKINRDVIRSHLIAPSPYLEGEYLSVNSRAVEFVENSGIKKGIKASHGWPENRTVDILREDKFYNHDFKPYSVLLISAPLMGPIKEILIDNSLDSSNNSTLEILPEENSLIEFRNWLHSNPEYRGILKSLARSAAEFNNSYIIVAGFMDHVKMKLEDMIYSAVDNIVSISPNLEYKGVTSLSNSDNIYNRLVEIISTYTLGMVKEKVFNSIVTSCSDSDAILTSRFKKMDLISKDVDSTAMLLGLNKDLICDMSECSDLFLKIEEYDTPLEKLINLKNTVNCVMKTVENHVKNKKIKNVAVTTDDLIPLILLLLINTKIPNINAHINYIEIFGFGCGDNDPELGFNLVSFQAALKHLIDENVEKLYGIIDDTQIDNKTLNAFVDDVSEELENNIHISPFSRSNSSKRTDGIFSLQNLPSQSKEQKYRKKKITGAWKQAPVALDLNEKEGDEGDFLASLRKMG